MTGWCACRFSSTTRPRAPFTARIGDDEISITRVVDGFAEIYLDPRKLESGDYTLSLKSQSGAEQLFPFTLKVTPSNEKKRRPVVRAPPYWPSRGGDANNYAASSAEPATTGLLCSNSSATATA